MKTTKKVSEKQTEELAAIFGHNSLIFDSASEILRIHLLRTNQS